MLLPLPGFQGVCNERVKVKQDHNIWPNLLSLALVFLGEELIEF
jgi:hypothetical protein